MSIAQTGIKALINTAAGSGNVSGSGGLLGTIFDSLGSLGLNISGSGVILDKRMVAENWPGFTDMWRGLGLDDLADRTEALGNRILTNAEDGFTLTKEEIDDLAQAGVRAAEIHGGPASHGIAELIKGVTNFIDSKGLAVRTFESAAPVGNPNFHLDAERAHVP